MHIKSLQIKNYRGLNDLHIEFNSPVDNHNSVDVLVGKNGAGKTSILELIAKFYNTGFALDEGGAKLDLVDYPDFPVLHKLVNGDLDRRYLGNLLSEVSKLTAGDTPPFANSQIIYMPALISMDSAGSNLGQLDLNYQFSYEISRDVIKKAVVYIKEYVIAQERLVEESSSKLRASKAIKIFNDKFKVLEPTVSLHKLDAALLNKPVFKNISGDEVSIDDLSDGEKQIYSRLIGLMMLQPNNSIILIDEPEAALHPTWQYDILKLYSAIGTGNQFIFATHSPQVLSSTSWKNVQVIARNEQGVKASKLNGPPSGSDGSSVLKGIMNAPGQPREVEGLKIEYRKLFKAGDEDSHKAKDLREKILEYENVDSVFFQELKLLSALQRKK